MAYAFDGLFAVDPSNPIMVAASAPVTIYDPADPTQAPLAITDASGLPIDNPVTTNSFGFVDPFQADIAQVGWKSGTYNGFTASYAGLRNEAVAASASASAAAASAQAAAQAAATNPGAGYTGPPVLVLGPTDPVPPGTAVGTIIVRASTAISGGGTGPVQQALGTPVVSAPAIASAGYIAPTLPTLTTGQVGTLVIVVGQTNGSTAWTAPAGWTKLYDNSMGTTYGTRPVGVFYAPAGTATANFAAPGGGTMRYIAAAFPVTKTPVLTGYGYKDSGASNATVTTASVSFAAASVPLTIITANYTTATAADPPTVPGAQVNEFTGPAKVSGTGSATTLHTIVGTPGQTAGGGATLTLSQPMASGSNFPTHVLGIGG